MLIRSQDNLDLINFESILMLSISKDCTKDIWRIYAILPGNLEVNFQKIAEYYSQEKAVYVLDKIETLYKFAKDKVFQMPADEELED